MKARASYVSNSSSSSFIVIPKDVQPSDIDYQKMAVAFAFDQDVNSWSGLFPFGCDEFGWQTAKYFDLESKWNWLVIQAYYGGDEYKAIIDDFLKSIDANLRVDWTMMASCGAYIDHQSVDPEGQFAEVGKIGIGEFLINDRCYVKNGNDNGDYE